MRVELTPSQAAVLRPLLDVANPFNRQLVIGQVVKGDWKAPEKTWLLCAVIKSTAGEKIRKLIQREQAAVSDPKVTS